MFYKNFKTVTYCVAGWVNHVTEEQLRKEADFLQACADNKSILFDITDELSKAVDIPVILGGGLSDMKSINDLINSTDIDFVSMQRPFVYNPTFLSQWKDGTEVESLCNTCNNCYWKKTSTCHIVHEDED